MYTTHRSSRVAVILRSSEHSTSPKTSSPGPRQTQPGRPSEQGISTGCSHSSPTWRLHLEDVVSQSHVGTSHSRVSRHDKPHSPHSRVIPHSPITFLTVESPLIDASFLTNTCERIWSLLTNQINPQFVTIHSTSQCRSSSQCRTPHSRVGSHPSQSRHSRSHPSQWLPHLN